MYFHIERLSWSMVRGESFILNWCTYPRYHVEEKFYLPFPDRENGGIRLSVRASVRMSRTLRIITRQSTDRFSPFFWDFFGSQMCTINVICLPCSSEVVIHGSIIESQQPLVCHILNPAYLYRLAPGICNAMHMIFASFIWRGKFQWSVC